MERAQRAPRPFDRAVFGDSLNGVPAALPRKIEDDDLVFGSFGAVLQGDQLGVEFGIDGHSGLLRDNGLLSTQTQLLSSRLVRPTALHEGLLIDDFFAIGEAPLDQLKPGSPSSRVPSIAAEAFHKAKAAYAAEGLKGSDAKDVFDQSRATVIGAEIDSSFGLAKHGLVTVAAPAQKRISLAWICLESASLPHTSDALSASLVGSLVSALCFRRSAMCLLDRVFSLVHPSELNT